MEAMRFLKIEMEDELLGSKPGVKLERPDQNESFEEDYLLQDSLKNVLYEGQEEQSESTEEGFPKESNRQIAECCEIAVNEELKVVCTKKEENFTPTDKNAENNEVIDKDEIAAEEMLPKMNISLPQLLETSDIPVFFARVERAFAANNIINENNKFDLLVETLRPQDIMEFREILISPDEEAPYNQLKAAILKADEEDRMRQLINECLCDRTPSQFLKRLRFLVGTNDDLPIVRQIFIHRLPYVVQIALSKADRNKDLTALAESLDIVMRAIEYNSQESNNPFIVPQGLFQAPLMPSRSSYAVHYEPSTQSAVSSLPDSTYKNITNTLALLVENVEALDKTMKMMYSKKNHRRRSHSRGKYQCSTG